MHRLWMPFMILGLLFQPIGLLAATYTLRASGQGDFPTIQAALNVAQDGDVVMLEDGVYRWPGNRDLEIYTDVVIRSVNGAEDCIIECDGSEAEPHRAFILQDEADPTIIGLTVRNGWHLEGGAARLGFGHYQFIDCVFMENAAGSGGGAFQVEDGGVLMLERCVFSHNTAADRGGAILGTTGAEIQVSETTFVRNGAPLGGALYLESGATLDVQQSVLAFGLQGGAYADNYGGGASFSCTDVFGNRGGDWTGGMGAPGADGNLCVDPLLADPMADFPDVGLALASPCRAAATGCGVMGAGPELSGELVVYGVAADGSGQVATIQEAIDLVATPAEIRLEDGTYTGPGQRDLDSGGASFLLGSRGGTAAACILDAQASPADPHRHLNLQGVGRQVVLEDLTLQNGHVEGDGGSVRNLDEGITLVVRRCMLRDNAAEEDGGAIHLRGGQLFLDEGDLEGNRSQRKGGGVAVVQSALHIDGTYLDGNQASVGGGGIWAEPGAASGQILNAEILNNAGGGLRLREPAGEWLVDSCLFVDNETAGYGGGAHLDGLVEGAEISFLNCTFNGNSALADGGGLYLNGYAGVLTCTFLRNSARYGGGLYQTPYPGPVGNPVLEGTEFIENEAEAYAGAKLESSVLASNLRCLGNRAEYDVGGMMLKADILPLTDCWFAANEAGQRIGALQLDGGSLSRCVFVDNTAAHHTAAVSTASGATFSQCTIAGNRITDPGEDDCQIYSEIDIFHPLDPGIGVVLDRCIVAFGENTRAVAGCNRVFLDTPPTAVCSSLWANDLGLGSLAGGESMVFDPRFCGLETGDITLRPSSPCLPAASSCGELIGARDVGCAEPSAVADPVTPARPRLLGNYPNPFNPRTRVVFELPEAGHVTLEVLDVAGRRLDVLLDEMRGSGRHEVAWHGRDAAGRDLPSGIYLLRLSTGGRVMVDRMALLR